MMYKKECGKKVIQKTLRFYDDSPDDMAAFEKLNDYKKYGFSTAREMLIQAVNAFCEENDYKKELLSNVEEIAEAVVERLRKTDVMVIGSNNTEAGEQHDEESNVKFAQAIEFIDSL